MPGEADRVDWPNNLEANLLALDERLPDTARLIRLMDTLPAEPTIGRDGSPTYTYQEPDGTRRWLGRTSMPSVSAPALLEAFQPGEAGVLFYTFGHGAEARLLLEQMAAHRALMIVEPDSWKARAALMLHDFSDPIRRGRLLLFVGTGAWEALSAFLSEHPGYLEPQRILSWPWFDPAVIDDVTKKVSSINSNLVTARLQARTRSSQIHMQEGTIRLAVLSNACTAKVRTRSRVLSRAAAVLGWDARRFVLDDPAMAHPMAIEAALAEFAPSLCILLDILPHESAYPLTNAPTCVIHSSTAIMDAALPARLGSAAMLAVLDNQIRSAAIAAGVKADRVLVISPAAQPDTLPAPRTSGLPICVVADGGDPSPAAAGLHLATHCRIWHAAEQIIRERVDSFVDTDTHDIIHATEKRLGIKLESAEVRTGIADRVRMRLAPFVVRMEYLKALMADGIPFDLFGEGWQDHADLTPYHRGCWPEPEALPDVLRTYATSIFISSDNRLPEALPDVLAAGLVAFARCTREEHRAPDSFGWDSAQRFTTRNELIKGLRAYLSKPAPLLEKSAGVSHRVRTEHTWTHRLRQIAAACGVVNASAVAEAPCA